MSLAPQGDKNGVNGWGLFFSEHGVYMRTQWGDLRTAQFGYGGIGRVMISYALPFGQLWYDGPGAVANAIGDAIHYSRSYDAAIRVYDAAGNVIETH